METRKMPKLISTIDAAEILGVTRYTVVRWINGDGVTTPLPAKKVGRGYRISEPALMNWFETGNDKAA